MLRKGPENANRFVQCVCTGGAQALADLATREYAFEPPEFVTQTCELCYLARRYLSRYHPHVFGPPEIYGKAGPVEAGR